MTLILSYGAILNLLPALRSRFYLKFALVPLVGLSHPTSPAWQGASVAIEPVREEEGWSGRAGNPKSDRGNPRTVRDHVSVIAGCWWVLLLAAFMFSRLRKRSSFFSAQSREISPFDRLPILFPARGIGSQALGYFLISRF